MSVRFLALVRRVDKARAGLSLAPTCVLWALADHADTEGRSFPSQALLALETGMGVRHVRRCLGELAKLGPLEWSRGGRTTPNHYRLRADVLAAMPVVSTGSPEPLASEAATGLPEPLATGLPEPVKPAEERTATGSPEPVRPDICDTSTGSPEPRKRQEASLKRQILTLSGEPDPTLSKKSKSRKPPKHTPEQIAAHDRVLEAWVAGVKSAKELEDVKVSHGGDHAAIYQLLREYGEAETLSMFVAALKDPHVLSSNCTLRYIASKPESWRGRAPANGRLAAEPPQDETPEGKLRRLLAVAEQHVAEGSNASISQRDRLRRRLEALLNPPLEEPPLSLEESAKAAQRCLEELRASRSGGVAS